MSNSIELQPFAIVEQWGETASDDLCVADGDTTLSFSGMRDFAIQVSAALRALGMQPGDVAALELPTVISTVFTAALLREAAVSVVLPSAHSTSAGFDAQWLFSSERDTSLAARRTVRIDAAFLNNLARHPPVNPRSFASRQSLTRIVFSSGTTGVPKAVPLTLEMVHHRAEAALELWPAAGAFLCVLGLGSASGFHTLFAALMSGRLYVGAGEPEHNLSQIIRHRVGAIKVSPVQLSRLIDASINRPGQEPTVALASLRRIYVAGSIVPRVLRERVEAHTTAELVTLFGSTEAGRCTQRTLHSADPELSNVGRAVPDTELQIVDDFDGALASEEVGFVRYRRPHQATGYVKNESATRASFLNGWFYTGDRGSLNSRGELTLVGRTSDLVNAGGVKLNLADIDHFALTQSGVVDAASFLYDDSSGVPRIGLAVVADRNLDLTDLVRLLQNHLGSRAPATLFKLPEIPKNDAGKVDRALLTSTFQRLDSS